MGWHFDFDAFAILGLAGDGAFRERDAGSETEPSFWAMIFLMSKFLAVASYFSMAGLTALTLPSVTTVACGPSVPASASRRFTTGPIAVPPAQVRKMWW